MSYSISGKNELETEDGTRFVFDGNTVSSDNDSYQELILIKSPETDQLAGKNYAGTMYKNNNEAESNLHTTFAANSDAIKAIFPGYTVKKGTLIGNFAAKFTLGYGNENAEATVLMILVNGSLETDLLLNSRGTMLHGTLFGFDLNVVGYSIFAKNKQNSIFTLYGIELNALYSCTVERYADVLFRYNIPAVNTIEFTLDGKTRFIFDGESVTSNNDRYKESVLIRKAEKNPLSGKIFTGTFYRSNGEVLHPNFFYNFYNNGTQVAAGFHVGIALRTSLYTLVNFNSARILSLNGDKELMVPVDGKLEVNYFDKAANTVHHGSFEQY